MLQSTIKGNLFERGREGITPPQVCTVTQIHYIAWREGTLGYLLH